MANVDITFDAMTLLIRVYSIIVVAKKKVYRLTRRWDLDQMQNEEWDVQVHGFRIHVAARR